MTILRVGSNQKYAEAFDRAFGNKKKTATKAASTTKATKKAKSAKKVAPASAKKKKAKGKK